MNYGFSTNKKNVTFMISGISLPLGFKIPIFYEIFLNDVAETDPQCQLTLTTVGTPYGYNNCNFNQSNNNYQAYNSRNDSSIAYWIFGPLKTNQCYSTTILLLNLRPMNPNSDGIQSFEFIITDIGSYNQITITNIYNSNTTNVYIKCQTFVYENSLGSNDSVTINYSNSN
jgi:hypothetical protein